MFKKTMSAIAILSALAIAVPALAENTPSPTAVNHDTSNHGIKPTASTGLTSAQIACVSRAVSARESALDSAIATYTQALSAAYTARAAALANAYGMTNNAAIKAAIKTAWATFTASARSARLAWQSSRNSAWSQYRAALKVCKAPAVATDSSNASSEPAGQ